MPCLIYSYYKLLLLAGRGCTDSLPANFDTNATVDDGSCTPIHCDCTNKDANNYDPLYNVDDGSCSFAGSHDSTCSNYNPLFTFDDGWCLKSLRRQRSLSGSRRRQDDARVLGCRDPKAKNHSPNAAHIDSECEYAVKG